MLAQQFNYEYTILHTACDMELKHEVGVRDVFFNKDCVVFEQKMYQMNLRENNGSIPLEYLVQR
jgi:hypothetical protein